MRMIGPFYRGKETKYKAKKTDYNGIIFDSVKEKNRYIQLKELENNNKINYLQRQVNFVLQESFINNTGNKIRPICYVADFVYEQDGRKIVEDVKSPMTRQLPDYRLKKKMFMYKYPDYSFEEFI